MTPLLLSLALTSPAQQPVYTPPITIAPRVVVQPSIQPYPAYRPPVVYVPVPVPVLNPNYPGYPTQPVVPQAATLSEFSRFFTPTPGAHDVWIVHPVTRQPVRVSFVLPAGKLRSVDVDRRSIQFEFRNGIVDIEFRNNGTVDVSYRN